MTDIDSKTDGLISLHNHKYNCHVLVNNFYQTCDVSQDLVGTTQVEDLLVGQLHRTSSSQKKMKCVELAKVLSPSSK